MGRPRKAKQPALDELATGDSLRARIDALEGALKPFAEYGRVLRLGDRRGAAMKTVCDLGRIELTMGDFDRARELVGGGK